ncbi:MAG: hypothetical protein H7124_06865 [Phycisphaerales bacterium]|nr:hypothetical protein [Hyphomonadaceae bacterium]
MDHRVSELATLVQEASDLLRRHSVTFWADWLGDDAARIRQLDFSGIEHLLSAYGGMGSLTDVYICPQSGHAIEAKNVESVNARLGSLLNRMYDGAKQLSREEFAATRRDPAI